MKLSKQDKSWALWYFVFAVGFVALTYNWWSSFSQSDTVPYSQFEQMVAEGKISHATVSADQITATLKAPTAEGRRFVATTRVDPAIADKLAMKGVVVQGALRAGFLTQLLSWVLPVLGFYILWTFLFSRMSAGGGLGGLMTLGRSSAKVYAETDTKVTFKDVAGVDEAKAELQETVAFLKDPRSFGRLGARAPKGILLVGPPGTGKTLLARAVAGEAGVPFFSISGAEFIEMFVGVGAARVRDLFNQARKVAPAIIFIDELDSLGKTRAGPQITGGFDEREQTVNQLLAELDGFDPTTGVILLAATNRPEVLDPALLRPGRFDRQVLIDRPDRRGRLEILKVHVGHVRLSGELDLSEVAAITPGFTGADLANLVNEAAIMATRRGASAIAYDDFTTAMERIVAGLEKRSRVLAPDERRRVAFHEMGHAIVAASLPGVEPVLKVSMIPRGVGALGYTIQRPTEDKFLITASDLRDRITVLLGGRAAEALAFEGNVSTGAADDLQRATQVALDMVTRHGMSDQLGQRTYLPPPSPFLAGFGTDRPNAAELTMREIDVASRNIVTAAFEKATEILKQRQHDLNSGAALLLEKETLTAEEFPALQQTATQRTPYEPELHLLEAGRR